MYFVKKTESVFYSFVGNDFYCVLKSMLASRRSTQTYGECWNLSIFSLQGPFLDVSGQDKDLVWQGGVLKLMKNNQEKMIWNDKSARYSSLPNCFMEIFMEKDPF